jgi:sulfoxide reductase heme-binding subunit YedZ
VNALANQALWTLGRGSGVAALLMFTVSIVLGIVSRSGRGILGVGRFGVQELHRTAALTGTALIAVHVGSLLLDPYAQLRLFDTVVPFAGQFRPFWQGLGTLALDLLVLVVVVSLMRRQVGPRVFRAVHWATYAMWPIALAHAIGNGTDGTSRWMLAVAGICSAAVLGTLSWRLGSAFAERGHQRTPRVLAHTGRPNP